MTAQAGSPVATISVTSKNEPWGEIVLRLFPDVAPRSCEELRRSGEEGLLQRHDVFTG
jgi:hypothetical protein